MVHFVGAGPGAIDLITVRGKNLLEKADVVIYAGSLVNPALLDYAANAKQIYDSQDMDLEAIIDAIKEAEAKDFEIVRLHTGEPSIYGAVREQMDELDKLGISYDSCPGVSACFGAASALNLEYTLPTVSQTLMITRVSGRTKVPEEESLKELAKHGSSMAIYLSTAHLDKVVEELKKGGLSGDTPCMLCYKVTWEDEKIFNCRLNDLSLTAKENEIDKTAIVLVGGAVGITEYERSFLYSPKKQRNV